MEEHAGRCSILAFRGAYAGDSSQLAFENPELIKELQKQQKYSVFTNCRKMNCSLLVRRRKNTRERTECIGARSLKNWRNSAREIIAGNIRKGTGRKKDKI